ncbi:MAG: transposase [Planctomycetota bacterium]
MSRRLITYKSAHIAGMYVKGISARKMNDVLEKLCGLQISSSQVRWANCS